MSCPLYKSLKKNGTSFYAFPGAAEDISASYQNQNYKMYFSKYILLNFPKQNSENIGSYSSSDPVTFDFDVFSKLTNTGQVASTFQDQFIESLRNYVANHEVTLRESKLNNTEYYYDTTALETTSEKIFWKWCKKLKLIDFEPAIDGDEYFGNLLEFQRNNLTDDTYFPEVIWKEREINTYKIKSFDTETVNLVSYLKIEFDTTLTNYKVGDYILISDTDIVSGLDGTKTKIQSLIPSDSTYNQRAVLELPYSLYTTTTATTTLIYNKLVQYIGEVNGVNNVNNANRSYTEVYAHIPDHTGQTPDILFRTMTDVNYKPGMNYPILPAQYQPEILGAELFNSPIVNAPQNYPGNYYGQFDTQDEYTYQTSDGDSIRRRGDYYGINGDINDPVIDGSTIDGVNVDFNTSHYVKMNIINREITNFDQFNALEVNNQPPKDFEFNAILWYYTVEDINGNSATNLYGISILDNPDNNPIESEVGLRFPTFKKLAANDDQDGISYAFSLNLNYNIITENPQDSYNPDAINSLFGFNLYNEAMRRLSLANDSFNNILASQNELQKQLDTVTQLIYTQTDFTNINNKISNLEYLLGLYQYTQIESSDTIEVTSNDGLNPPTVMLNSIDPQYVQINNINTTDLYNQSGIIPMSISVPTNKNFLIRITNNDETSLNLPNNDKLTVYLDGDLSYRQSLDIYIDSTDYATQNKQLEFYITYSNGGVNQLPVLTKAIDTVDLPIYYNSYLQVQNSSKSWDRFDFDVNLDNDISVTTNGILTLSLTGLTQQILINSVKKGDTLQIKDFTVGTSSTISFSGQYTVDSIDTVGTNKKVNFDVSNNSNIMTYVNNIGSTVILNSILIGRPYIDLNKGSKYRITRVNSGLTASFADRYQIDKY